MPSPLTLSPFNFHDHMGNLILLKVTLMNDAPIPFVCTLEFIIAFTWASDQSTVGRKNPTN